MPDKETIYVTNVRGKGILPVRADIAEVEAAGVRYPWPTFGDAERALGRAGYACAFEIVPGQAETDEAKTKPAPKRKEGKQKSAPAIPSPKIHASTLPVHLTREAWLLAAIEIFRPWFSNVGARIPDKVYASCGWALGTRKAIGQAFHASMCADGSHAVFVSPVIDNASRALDILLHELCHTALEPKTKHRTPFAKLAGSLGLVKPWTATTASPELLDRLQPVLAKLGAYPHAKLDGAKREKQTTRLLKADCAICGYTVRITAKWLDQAGLPHCPDHGEMKCDSWDGEASNV